MRYAIEGAVLALWFLAAGSAGAQPVADVVNASKPTLCAESDNVNLTLASPQVKGFSIEARHPAYIGALVADRSAPDFHNCDMSGEPTYKSTARRVTLYEDEEWQLIGHTFPSFWRPNQVPVTAGGRTETGLHLLQLWTRFQERAEEVLVLYPADGYWRARPLPPAHLRWSAYGSSFLVGPLEDNGRPLVDLSRVAFDPSTRSFTLTFSRGGQATVGLAELNQDRIKLAVEFASPIAPNPFAAIRSMYVTRDNADGAEVAWRPSGAIGWSEAPVMQFAGAKAVAGVQLSRTVPSRHNTSAPDLAIDEFR
jgi:hypothetical protein